MKYIVLNEREMKVGELGKNTGGKMTRIRNNLKVKTQPRLGLLVVLLYANHPLEPLIWFAPL